jgi:DDE superfamily endonuclease
LASKDGYEESALPNGALAGAPEDPLDTACGLYLNDPTEPYASADRVFWIVDNGSSHRGQKATDRLAEQFPNAIMVHTPVHASWLNQIEIYYSIVQRKSALTQRLPRSRCRRRTSRR